MEPEEQVLQVAQAQPAAFQVCAGTSPAIAQPQTRLTESSQGASAVQGLHGCLSITLYTLNVLQFYLPILFI